MRAGKLRHRIALQSSAPTEDGGGGRTLTWSTYANVWADRKVTGSGEPTVAEKPQSQVSYSFEIRYRSDVTAKHRILYEGLAYNIRAVEPGERRDHITLKADEGVAL